MDSYFPFLSYLLSPFIFGFLRNDVVTKYFDTKSSEKSMEKVNKNKVSLAPLYKCKLFLTKRKIENWQKYGHAYISMVCNSLIQPTRS